MNTLRKKICTISCTLLVASIFIAPAPAQAKGAQISQGTLENIVTLFTLLKANTSDLEKIARIDFLITALSLAAKNENNAHAKIPPPVQDTRPLLTNIAVEDRPQTEDDYYLHPLRGLGSVTQGHHGPHDAIDYKAPIGTPIYASADGVVTIANTTSYAGGYGNYVLIDHPNLSQTLYAHMDSLTVELGEEVFKRQLIGYVGDTGNATTPHVHFELRNGIPIPF